MAIISGVNFRPIKCWAKVEQKSCAPKTRKKPLFFDTPEVEKCPYLTS